MNLAVIPARSGSKGVPNKNIAHLGDKALIRYTIEAALESKLFDRIVVTTDSKKIASLTADVTHIIRDPKLAGDDVPLAPVIIDALKRCENGKVYDTITTLQPTSPFRTARHIQEAMKRFKKTDADSLISVKEELHSVWDRYMGVMNRLDRGPVNRQLKNPLYIGNGAIFITKRDILLEYEDRLGGIIEIYVMDDVSSLDIDTKEDFAKAEWYIRTKLIN